MYYYCYNTHALWYYCHNNHAMIQTWKADTQLSHDMHTLHDTDAHAVRYKCHWDNCYDTHALYSMSIMAMTISVSLVSSISSCCIIQIPLGLLSSLLLMLCDALNIIYTVMEGWYSYCMVQITLEWHTKLLHWWLNCYNTHAVWYRWYSAGIPKYLYHTSASYSLSIMAIIYSCYMIQMLMG